MLDWLFTAAFPIWWHVGADHVAGGFHERIDFDGRPVTLPRRVRVTARQAFCFHEAGRLGWDGPWREAGQHALSFLRERFAQSNGTVISTVNQDGSVVDAIFDLYNQAFALLAYACGHRSLDPSGGWQSRAYTLVQTLKRDFAHPAGGFREDRDGRLTLRANPHMHLLEAALAWLASIPIRSGAIWQMRLLRCASIVSSIVIPPRCVNCSLPIGRRFRKAGEVLEPGHHYEWTFLLDRWAKLTGRKQPLKFRSS